MDITKALPLLLAMAQSHIEDIDEGLESGLYDESDNSDIEEKRKAMELLEKMIEERTQIPRFSLLHSGNNAGGYTAEASLTGDSGIYEEVRISAFNKEGDCCADVLLTLSDEGNGAPLIYVTADGEGNSDHQITIRPLLPAYEAVTVVEVK